MISLSDIYNKYYASGVYTVYSDQTIQPIPEDDSPIRLVAGSSRNNPHLANRLVRINRGNYELLNILFPEDKQLERFGGSFFHRSIKTAIAEGDVLAMNLLLTRNQEETQNFTPTYPADKTPYISLSASLSETNGKLTEKLYSSYFNKERFWRQDTRYLLATRSVADSDQIINVVNLSNTPVSILFKKSTLPGYNITMEEWYSVSTEDMPSYVKPTDYVSDYMIDVYVVQGNWTNYQALSVNPAWSKYFNSKGVIASKLDEFVSETGVTLVGRYQGSIIPRFKDQDGTDLYIENIINRNYAATGLMLAIDKNQLDSHQFSKNTKNLDLVGHSLTDGTTTSVNCMSYNQSIIDDYNVVLSTLASISKVTIDTTSGVTIAQTVPGTISVTVTDVNANFDALKGAIAVGQIFIGEVTAAGSNAGITVTDAYLEVSSLTSGTTTISFTLTNHYKKLETSVSGSFVDLKVTNDDIEMYTSLSYMEQVTGQPQWVLGTGHQLYTDWSNDVLEDGDTITDSSDNVYYLKYEEVYDESYVAADGRPALLISVYTDAGLTTAATDVQVGGLPTDTKNSAGYVVSAADTVAIVSPIGNIKENVPATKLSKLTCRIPKANESDVAVGEFLLGVDEDGNDILTRITRIARVDPGNTGSYTHIDVTTTGEINFTLTTTSTTQVTRYKSITDFIPELKMFYLKGFQLQDHHLPDGTNDRVKEIYSVMTTGNIRTSLTDADMSNYRYFVDTFNCGIESGTKSYLTSMFKDRQTCLGLLNGPSMDEILESTDPRFTDTPTDVNPVVSFNSEYLLDGGNLSENPSKIYTMPTDSQGASYAGMFMPNLIYEDTDVTVPPAAAVSNAFIRKWSAARQFAAVANERRGILTDDGLIGIEYNFDQDQRGDLERKGINPLIFRNGNVMIFGNQTMYQQFQSTLNSLHARDILITLQRDMEAILNRYIFEFARDANTEAETLINNYLSLHRDSYRSISSFDVVIDSSNNPDEIVATNTSIIDTSVEIASVNRRFINRITLVRGGFVSVGGFTSA